MRLNTNGAQLCTDRVRCSAKTAWRSSSVRARVFRDPYLYPLLNLPERVGKLPKCHNRLNPGRETEGMDTGAPFQTNESNSCSAHVGSVPASRRRDRCHLIPTDLSALIPGSEMNKPGISN